MNDNVIEVSTADCVVSELPHILVSHGIGSCVVVCLYDRVQHVGALGHFMLPKAPIGYSGGYRYIDFGLSSMVASMVKRGVNKSVLVASVIGGAQMFRAMESSILNIGQRNINEATLWLRTYEIKVGFTDVGGHAGRNVRFDLNTGVVDVNRNL